ncbi:hypothetical protein MJO28_001387 [Puccinia striiformis f. sp. tritici]|uniref:Uncharacterized protein n=1 Tax=Puccinia striiformis f. sp. tritici TaxID=168172 RepID=A0ACC0ETE9_9BASI|nr:hypothetical protein MJO28_001387 [Puccinia striiformis f. sp. tritici]KAI7965668.1 hypothetical protein MJO29_001416 [Puccinia striiformis f. sp. tritici]
MQHMSYLTRFASISIVIPISTIFVRIIMFAAHLLPVGMWFITISSGITASVDGPSFVIEVTQEVGDASRALRALSVEEEPQTQPRCMIPSRYIGSRRQRRAPLPCGSKFVENWKFAWRALLARTGANDHTFKNIQRKIVRSKKGLETIKNWDLNQDQVASLREYAAQFAEWEVEIQKQIKWLGKNKMNVDRMITQASPNSSPQALSRVQELFNEIKEQIKVLKNMRLMLLGAAFDIPEEIFRLITESSPRNLVQSVKKFITENNHLFNCLALGFVPKHPKFQYEKDQRYRLYTLTPLDYAFEIIDFLLEHRFIKTEEVGNIFQDKEMVEQVVNYTVRRYENDLGFCSWKYMSNLTKHWHWQSMNKFFRALSKKELDRIDLVFLIGKLGCIDGLPGALYDSEVLDIGDRPFPYEKYFGKSNSLNRLVSPGFKHGPIGHWIYPEFDPKEKDEIIHHLLSKRYGRRKLICIVDLFAFMEEEFCPGIISQL